MSNEAVVAKFATTTQHGAIKGKTQTHMVEYYNLDMIISVGYRVKSKNGIIFRKWATSILKDYMIKGYTVNEKRLEVLNKTIAIQTKMLASALDIEEKEVLNVIEAYSNALSLLDDYDHGCISKPKGKHSIYRLTYEECKTLIDSMKYGGFSDVFGVVRVTNAFLPLLRKSDNPVIVNVSSGLGSFGMVTDDTTNESKINSLTYCSSKAAVSMLTLQYAKGLPDIKVNCADPGATATDLNGGKGKQTVHEGTDAIIKLATIDKDGPTGTFVNRFGDMPW